MYQPEVEIIYIYIHQSKMEFQERINNTHTHKFINLKWSFKKE